MAPLGTRSRNAAKRWGNLAHDIFFAASIQYSAMVAKASFRNYGGIIVIIIIMPQLQCKVKNWQFITAICYLQLLMLLQVRTAQVLVALLWARCPLGMQPIIRFCQPLQQCVAPQVWCLHPQQQLQQQLQQVWPVPTKLCQDHWCQQACFWERAWCPSQQR